MELLLYHSCKLLWGDALPEKDDIGQKAWSIPEGATTPVRRKPSRSFVIVGRFSNEPDVSSHQTLIWGTRRPAGFRSLPEQSRDSPRIRGNSRLDARRECPECRREKDDARGSPFYPPDFLITSLNEGVKTSCSKMPATRLRIRSPLLPDRSGSGKE